MQVLRAESSAGSTGVFSIFSGMTEMKYVPEPLDLTLGRDVFRLFLVFKTPAAQNGDGRGRPPCCSVEHAWVLRRSTYLRAKRLLPLFEHLDLGPVIPRQLGQSGYSVRFPTREPRRDVCLPIAQLLGTRVKPRLLPLSSTESDMEGWKSL